jgi:hypothetical protein
MICTVEAVAVTILYIGGIYNERSILRKRRGLISPCCCSGAPSNFTVQYDILLKKCASCGVRVSATRFLDPRNEDALLSFLKMIFHFWLDNILPRGIISS